MSCRTAYKCVLYYNTYLTDKVGICSIHFRYYFTSLGKLQTVFNNLEQIQLLASFWIDFL